jgi:uncharacterized coiled-coil protein SlyX
MRRRRSDEVMSLRFIANWEQRVAKQKQAIDQLKRRGCPTAEANAALDQQQETLAKLRNHADLMQALMSPDVHGKKPAST